MNWLWFAVGIIILIAAAAIAEAVIWRGVKRPLARHSARKPDALAERSKQPPLGLEGVEMEELRRTLKLNAVLSETHDTLTDQHLTRRRKFWWGR